MIIVETGSIVTNANSYVSRADYITFAAGFGIAIDNNEAADFELVSAAQFIDQHESNLKGSKVKRDQPMSFPRSAVEIDGWPWNYTEIPRNVLLCQMQTALDIHNGFDPWNKSKNPNLLKRRERVEGAIDVEYAISARGTDQKLSRTSRADALLNSLLKNSGLFNISMERR